MVRVGLTTPKVRERVNHVFRFGGGEKEVLEVRGCCQIWGKCDFPPKFWLKTFWRISILYFF